MFDGTLREIGLLSWNASQVRELARLELTGAMLDERAQSKRYFDVTTYSIVSTSLKCHTRWHCRCLGEHPLRERCCKVHRLCLTSDNVGTGLQSATFTKFGARDFGSGKILPSTPLPVITGKEGLSSRDAYKITCNFTLPFVLKHTDKTHAQARVHTCPQRQQKMETDNLTIHHNAPFLHQLYEHSILFSVFVMSTSLLTNAPASSGP